MAAIGAAAGVIGFVILMCAVLSAVMAMGTKPGAKARQGEPDELARLVGALADELERRSRR